MTLMQVVLPEPLGPTNPRISPGLRSKLKPSRAWKPPKRFTRLSTVSSGERSVLGDIDPPAAQQRGQSVGQEQHQTHDEQAVDELEILRRRDADGVVDAVEDDDAEDGADDGRGAAEQREDDGEDADLAGERRLRIEGRDAPGEDAADEAGDERREQPGDDALAHHVDAGHGGADRILAD